MRREHVSVGELRFWLIFMYTASLNPDSQLLVLQMSELSLRLVMYKPQIGHIVSSNPIVNSFILTKVFYCFSKKAGKFVYQDTGPITAL